MIIIYINQAKIEILFGYIHLSLGKYSFRYSYQKQREDWIIMSLLSTPTSLVKHI